MSNSFDDIFDWQRPAHVAEQKLTNYTITPIGGPDEYKAYLERKKIMMEARAKQQHEMFLLKHSFAIEILGGRAEASTAALTPAPTLQRFQMEHGAKCQNKPIQPSNIELVEELKMPEPTWYSRVMKVFSRL
jgi:hypothetical protein